MSKRALQEADGKKEQLEREIADPRSPTGSLCCPQGKLCQRA